MMYAEDPQTIREWIRDGVPAARAASRSWQAERDAGVLVMPAFGDRLRETDLDHLVAFVQAVGGGAVPGDSLARAGRERAEALGCFGCHGPGGRFAPPNPGSLKGYIPSWDEADFPELVRDRAEFAEWVEQGVADRFARNRFASFFLDRAALHMPAYEEHLEPGDLDALWAYITWLRTPAP
jgi:mono/diheme cytochrome c family protein